MVPEVGSFRLTLINKGCDQGRGDPPVGGRPAAAGDCYAAADPGPADAIDGESAGATGVLVSGPSTVAGDPFQPAGLNAEAVGPRHKQEPRW